MLEFPYRPERGRFLNLIYAQRPLASARRFFRDPLSGVDLDPLTNPRPLFSTKGRMKCALLSFLALGIARRPLAGTA